VHYLVTGGCGFIGKSLVCRLLQAGHAVTIVDDLSNSSASAAPAGARLVVQDITAEGAFDALLPGVDGVFHLAAIVSVSRSTQAWRQTHQVTLGGTVALFDALARLRRTIPVVYASTAAVYGDSTQIPFTENALPAPISAYGADKLACELHARVGQHVHGIPSVGLRFFNIYGAGQDPHSPYSGVVSIFLNQMRSGHPVTIFGDGEQTRDYVNIDDTVRSMQLAMQKLESRDVSVGVYNVCSGVPVSVNRLAHTLLKLTGSESRLVHAAPRSDDIRFSVGNDGLAATRLGFKAQVALEAGLKSLLNERS